MRRRFASCGRSTLPSRQAAEVDIQERRMMSVRVMVEESVEDGQLRERSLWRRAWVFIETHCACSGRGGSGACLWW